MPEKIVDQKATEAYINDMARYSIINNLRRSIPDLKDGLKPVQRRIIYAMDRNEHALSESSKVKCASIVGTVMKWYHAHGDSCITYDTLVWGLDGNTYQIGQLYDSGVEYLDVLSVDPNTGNVVPAVARAFRIGKYTDKIYHIVLSNGAELKVTDNHPILLNNLTWIRADQIRKNMELWSRLNKKRSNNDYKLIDKINVTNVWIENVNSVPMYDFTVDGYENMIIPMKSDNCFEVPFICIHNSIYDAMKPLANWFECKMPLIQPGGSFGSIMGGRAAASRYTEANLTQFALDCVIGQLHYSDAVVDWQDNYSNTTKEPEYLPAMVPLLLVNGASGIGVGTTVNIPTHNLGEVIDATLKLMNNPNAEVILIPDHCIPCEIVDTDWKAICNTGNGSYKARGFMEIGENKKGNPTITITSLPVYNTDRVKNQIEDLVATGKFPQIQDVVDESKLEVRIIVVLKKGSDAEFVKEALYKYTDCEKSFPVNFEVIDGIERMRMSYKSYLEAFIQFAMTNKFRFCCSKLSEINTRMHRLEAFIKVLESGYINDIIKMIQKRKEIDDNYIVEFLISKAKITDLQASFIINASIKQLSLGYLNKYREEFAKLNTEMNMFEAMISNDDLICDSVRQDLINAKNKYATPRISKVVKVSNFGNIPQGTFKIVITENNYIRKIGINDIVNVVKGDRPKFILSSVENTESILLFDNKGRVFKLPIHKVPIVGKSDPGIDIRTTIKGLTADIINVMYEPWIKNTAKMKGKFHIAVLSKGNIIKKLDINDFLSVPPSGIIYSKVNPDDSIISVQIISDQLDVVIYSGHKALRISAKEIPCYKRNTLGISAMNTNDDIEGMSIIYPEATDVIVTTHSGRVNRFSVTGLARSSRNKAGSSVIKLGKNDTIQSIYGATVNNTLHIVTMTDNINIPITSIDPGSSVSSGIKTVSTKSDIIIKTEII